MRFEKMRYLTKSCDISVKSKMYHFFKSLIQSTPYRRLQVARVFASSSPAARANMPSSVSPAQLATTSCSFARRPKFLNGVRCKKKSRTTLYLLLKTGADTAENKLPKDTT